MKSFPVMIVETNAAYRASLAQVVVDMGVPPTDIHSFASFAEAKGELARIRPRLLISEVGPEGQGGVELVAKLKLFDQPGREAIGILIANSVAQTSWAKSRTSLAKLVLSRPIPQEDLSTLLYRAVIDLLPPKAAKTPQIKVAQKNVAEAVRKFDLARTLSYGVGDGRAVKARVVELFEKLVASSRLEEAYALARNALPHMREFTWRFDEVLRLAVRTRSFDDLPELHEFFVAMDRKTDVMTRTMYAALMVGGKALISRGAYDRGYEFFLKAAVTSGNHLPVLREGIQALLDSGLPEKARALLGRFPLGDRQNPEYRVLSYCIDDRVLDDSELIQRGWALLKARVRDPRVYEIMIRRLVARGKMDPAENLASEASTQWPERESHFTRLIDLSPSVAP